MNSFLLRINLVALILLQGSAFGQKSKADKAMEEVFGEKIELPAQYSFQKSVRMELETRNASGEVLTRTVYLMRYQDQQTCIGMMPVEIGGQKAEPRSDVIVDFERMRMITFMHSNDSKMAMIHHIREDQIAGGRSTDPPKFKETGRTKTIEGFLCKEYEMKSNSVEGHVWLAPDLDINFAKSFEAIGLQLEIGDKGPYNEPSGFIMEFETVDRDTGEKTHMIVSEIDLDDQFKLSTKGYIYSSMPVVEEEEKY